MKKPSSLLYTPSQAAALDRTQLSSLGASALIELEALASAAGTPGVFSSFDAALVGNGAAGTLSGPRELLTPPDIARLHAVLDSVLLALRPHVLHRAGLKLLEFLVAVHRVHEARPVQLLLASLPYHSTPVYAKLSPLLKQASISTLPSGSTPRAQIVKAATAAPPPPSSQAQGPNFAWGSSSGAATDASRIELVPAATRFRLTSARA